MYNKNKVLVNILTSKKSGSLSSIMLNGRKAGLMFTSKKTIEVDDNTLRLSVVFEGSLNCHVKEFIKTIESHPEVRLVESFSNEETNIPVIETLSEDKNITINTDFKFKAHDAIDGKTIHIVEKKLKDYLGPIAPLLVQSTKSSCFTVGELFASLAKELKGREKEDFLSLVDFNNTDYLSISKEESKTIIANKDSSALSKKTENSSNDNRKIKLFSHELLSDEAMQIAENHLSKSLGPVATLLIQSAKEKTKHIGDFFLLLSEELEGLEKSEFLDLVDGVKLHEYS